MDLGPRTQEVLHAVLGRDAKARKLWRSQTIDPEFFDEIPERPMHYGFDGEPVSMRVWTILFESEKRLLAQEWIHVKDGLRVWLSTVWLGLDHNHARHYYETLAPGAIDTRPWVFETMAFRNEPGFADVFAARGDTVGEWRHATWQEAQEGHEDLARDLRSGASGILSIDGD